MRTIQSTINSLRRRTNGGLTATDNLGAFDWICDDSTGTARLISTGLKQGMYLSDLIFFDVISSAWNENTLTVNDNGTPIFTTVSAVWWSNPISVNNLGGEFKYEWSHIRGHLQSL